MQNKFNCYKCGEPNLIGKAVCSRCGERFQYSCPSCGGVVSGGDSKCAKCGNILSWPSLQQQTAPKPKRQDIERHERKGASPFLLLLGLIIVVVVGVVGIYFLVKFSENPQPGSTVGNITQSIPVEKPSADITAPIISDIRLISVGNSTADIRWVTDEPSTTQVYLQLKDDNPQPTPQKKAMVTQHSVELANLKDGSTYYYRVKSVDQAGNEAVSDEKSFDIGKKPGTAKLEVMAEELRVITEIGPTGTTTKIIGRIKNTGDYTVLPKDVEISVRYQLTDNPDFQDVIATLATRPSEIIVGAVHDFSAVVSNPVNPTTLSATARILSE